MQDWDNDIKGQLNNLPAFPRKQQWELGAWIEECHVRPEVADFASLPLTDNQVGDARISLADQAWYIWDGAAWQSMGGGGGGGVNSVTAVAPISSSGGANPQISLTGVVDVLHGGTGQTSLAANNVLLGDGTNPVQTVAPGTSGNVLTSDGTTWQSTPLPSSVTSVTASSPLASSGGATPDISLTGVVSTSNGGTGLSSLTPGAVLFGDDTNPVGTDGGQLYWDATNDRLGIGNGAPAETLSVGTSSQFQVDDTGNILRIHDVPYNWPNVPGASSTFLQNDGSGNLAWTTIAAGGVTSVAASSPLSVSGPAATPTVNLTGVVPVANGGTGQSTYTNGQLLIGNSTGNTLTKATLTPGSNVLITNGPGSITISVPGALGGTVTSVGLSTTLSGLTVGGTPVTGSGTLSLTGTLGATSGGTGQTSYTAGDLLYADTTTSLAKLADVATGNVLLSGGVGVAPSYGKVGLTTHVSGTLPVASGGTGATSLTANNVLVGNGTGAVQLIPPGSSGDVLTWNGTNWLSAPPTGGGGGVTSVTATAPILSSGGAFPDISLTAGTNTNDVLTWNGSAWVSSPPSGGGVASVTASAPLASSGGATPDISLTGVVAVANGGTGQSSLTLNNVVLGNGTSAVQTVAPGTSGNVLTSDGTTWQSTAPVVSSVSGSGGATGLTLTGGPTGAVTLTLGGTLDVDNGGTGQTSYTDGEILIGNSTGNTLTKTTLTPGSNVLITNGPGSITIDAPGALGGTVTSVGLSTSLSGLTVGGTPVTGSGTLTLGGTLGATSGGTGQTSYVVGDLLYANTTSTLAKLADIATGNVLLSGGVGVAPSYGKVGLTTHVSGVLPIGNGGTGRSSTPTNGQVLIGNGSGYTLNTITGSGGISVTNGAGSITISGAGISTPPAGSNTQLQFNNSGSFGASANLTFNTGVSPNALTLTGALTQTGGVFSLTGNGASTISTTGLGSTLTVTSAQQLNLVGGNLSRWDTTTGSITIQPATGLFLFPGSTSTFATTTGNLSCQAVAGNLNLVAGTAVILSGDAGVTIGSNTAGQSVVVNSTSINVDFRVSGDTDTNLLFTDASTDRVGIGTNTPATKLQVVGSFGQSGGGFLLDGNAASGIQTASGSNANIAVQPDGDLLLGTVNTNAVSIGRSAITTTITGGLTQTTGAFSLTGNAASTLSTSAGTITITPAATLNLGTATTTGVSIGRSGITTTITGGLTQTTGAISLTGNTSSSVTTSVGQLTVGTGGAASLITQTNATNRLQISSTGQYIFNGIGSGSGTTAVLTTIGNELLKLSSSLRYKTAVESLSTAVSENVLNLRAVSYKSTCASDDKDQTWYGLIAEEVEQVEPRLVHYTKDPEDDTKLIPDGVQYERVSVLLLDVVKRQKTKLDDLEQALQALQAEVAALKAQG